MRSEKGPIQQIRRKQQKGLVEERQRALEKISKTQARESEQGAAGAEPALSPGQKRA